MEKQRSRNAPPKIETVPQGRVKVPEDVHTVVAVTANYWGKGSTLAEALQNMHAEGGRRSWGYIVYGLRGDMEFSHVGSIHGDIHWSGKGELFRVGVRGSKTAF